jgi:hypothetical protein
MDYMVVRWRTSTQRTKMKMTTWVKEVGKRNTCNGGLTFWPRRVEKASARIHGPWSVAFSVMLRTTPLQNGVPVFVVSKFTEFVRTIDTEFEKYDMEGEYQAANPDIWVSLMN